jgi:hypothetical protein
VSPCAGSRADPEPRLNGSLVAGGAFQGLGENIPVRDDVARIRGSDFAAFIFVPMSSDFFITPADSECRFPETVGHPDMTIFGR